MILVALIIFVCLASEFVIRFALRRPVRKVVAQSGASTPASFGSSSETDLEKNGPGSRLSMKTRLLLAGMAFSILCLFIR